jgi:hypothetical protein
LQWTAAYPVIAHWLLQYYGDLAVVREHWPTLQLFMDNQRAQMKGNQSAPPVPDFWCVCARARVCVCARSCCL